MSCLHRHMNEKDAIKFQEGLGRAAGAYCAVRERAAEPGGQPASTARTAHDLVGPERYLAPEKYRAGDIAPLETIRDVSNFLVATHVAPDAFRGSGRYRRQLPALLYPCCSRGGCGYEDLRSITVLGFDRRLREN